MRRIVLVAVVLLLVGSAMGPAAASHDELGGPIIPWLHNGEAFDFAVGESVPIGARFGTCTYGLARAAMNATTLTLFVDGVEVDLSPTIVGPFGDVPIYEELDWSEICFSSAHGENGWWVYWTYEDTLAFGEPGNYEVSLRWVLDRPLTDGADFFPVDERPDVYAPGLLAEASVFIDVSAP